MQPLNGAFYPANDTRSEIYKPTNKTNTITIRRLTDPIKSLSGIYLSGASVLFSLRKRPIENPNGCVGRAGNARLSFV